MPSWPDTRGVTGNGPSKVLVILSLRRVGDSEAATRSGSFVVLLRIIVAGTEVSYT
jgi:hypothetical protein